MGSMAVLRLEAREVLGLDRWRWVLTGPDGRELACHEVRLDSESARYEAALDLPGYLWRHVAPDLRRMGEIAIVREVGRWLREEVLGPVADALRRAAPVVVHVVLPVHASYLRDLPLELAHVGGRPLALQDVTLVWTHEGDIVRPGHVSTPRGDRPVRVLGLFSLPETGRTLNLRRERWNLQRCFDEAARAGRGIEFLGLQYGVTRESLRSVLTRPEGWDLIHVSGHGTPGELVLETDKGTPDRISAIELVRLLASARGVELVTLSACWSAARAARAQRRLLELPPSATSSTDSGSEPRPEGRGMAHLAAVRLGCAVLAMRYPVADDFAIDLAERLYPRVLLEGHTLPSALAGTLREIEEERPGHEAGALQAATPTLVGARAAEFTLSAPTVPGRPRRPRVSLFMTPEPNTGGEVFRPMVEDPPVAARFVGRVSLMAQAGAVLSPRSDHRALLLRGMPGIGKTACAAELAATHAHSFENIVWFRVPLDPAGEADPDGLLMELALALERVIPGLRRAELLASVEWFAELSSLLRDVMRRCRLLLVIDGIDPLLDDERDWRDRRWGTLLESLVGHGGAGRVVLTGRDTPRSLPPGLLTVPIGLLTHDESMLLTRESPALFGLVQGTSPGVSAEMARRYVRALLEATHGHPRLLELTDGLCAAPEQAMASATSGGGVLDAFEGDDGPLAEIRAWTRTVLDGLPSDQRDLFLFLCCLEADDRVPLTLEQNWPDLCARLGHDEAPLGSRLRRLANLGLITPRLASASYDVQPEATAVGRDLAGDELQEMVVQRMSGYWLAVFREAWAREGADETPSHVASRLLSRAGLSAAPYLIRRGEPFSAEILLEAVLHRDKTKSTIAQVHPLLRRAAARRAKDGVDGHLTAGALDLVLGVVRPEDAEKQTRLVLKRARDEGDRSKTTAAMNGLIELCVKSGRMDEALELADELVDHVRRSRAGVWTRLLSEVRSVRVLAESRRADRALMRVPGLRRRIEEAPREQSISEGVTRWGVWEELHEAAQRAAITTHRWEEALRYNSELHRSRKERGAPVSQLVEGCFPAYKPLAELGYIDAASDLLDWCRRNTTDDSRLGDLFGALGNIEDLRGHGDVAIARAQDALRYLYKANVPFSIAIGHLNLGSYLHRYAQDGERAAAHHLAGTLLDRLVGGTATEAVWALANDLRVFGPAVELPMDLDRLAASVDTVPGVDLRRILRRPAPDPALPSDLLKEIVNEARHLAARLTESDAGETAWSMLWEPVIAALTASVRGDTAVYVHLRERLAVLEGMGPRFARLPGVLRRVHDGERGPALLIGLDPLETAIATRAQDVLERGAEVDTDLAPALHDGVLLSNVVSGAIGFRKGMDEARRMLAGRAEEPATESLVAALIEILDGGRGEGISTRLTDPTHRAMVRAVLIHIDRVETGDGHPR